MTIRPWPPQIPAQRAPLVTRLQPFHYRRSHASKFWTPTGRPPPEGWKPHGGCTLLDNNNLYIDPELGSAQSTELVMAGTDLSPREVQRRGGLFPRPPKEDLRDGDSVRCDAHGQYRGLGGHITGGRRRGYQSTTRTKSIALEFACRQGMRFDLSGYVYAAFACGVDVATGRAIDMEYKTQRAKGPMQQATLPLRLAWSQLVTNHYADEDELAVPDGVPVDDIVGMRKVERIAGGWGGRFIGPILVDRDLPNPWYNHAGSMLLNSDERANFRHF